MIIIIGVSLLITIIGVYIGVSALKEDAKEKAESEKGYTIWSVLSGFVIGFFVILYEIVCDLFFRRHRTRR